MNVVHERSALARPVSLFEHAQRLHRLTPYGPLPNGGRPFPDGGDQPKTPYRGRRAALTTVLREFIDDPVLTAQDLHDRCAGLTITTSGDVTGVLGDLAPEPVSRLLQTARWLVGNGTNRQAVLVGLGLLCGNADQDDVGMIKIIGLLCFAEQPAVEALAQIPGAEQDLIWLADRVRGHARVWTVEVLAGRPEPAVRRWVLSTPRELLSSDVARKIAETYGLAEALCGPVVDDTLWDQAGNLLLAMAGTHNAGSEIDRYEQAPTVYRRWVALAGERSPSLDRAALLTMVAEDLATGPAAPVVGDLRADLIDQIDDVLSELPWSQVVDDGARSGDPVEARRAAWIRAAPRGIPAEARFAVRVVVPDPAPVGSSQVEARVVIDGMPVVAAVFGKGPAQSPEWLVHSGRLRATDAPHDVMLAEAYCTEGCCGALYVTIVREGDEVVWKDWRTAMPGDPPPEVRFDAGAYDREVARAEQDHTWEWPARTLARLVSDRLRADPTILGRWDCELDWCTAWLRDFDTARLAFSHPAHTESFEGPCIQFGLVVEIADQDPQAAAAQLIESLRNTDPKHTAEMIGGSKDGAEQLGLVYREPRRW